MVQGFTHAHENEVSELLVRFEMPTRFEHLGNDFGRTQATNEPISTARTKDAPHRAAMLRRDTKRHSGFLLIRFAFENASRKAFPVSAARRKPGVIRADSLFLLVEHGQVRIVARLR